MSQDPKERDVLFDAIHTMPAALRPRALKGLGFGVQGLRVQGFRVEGLGIGVLRNFAQDIAIRKSRYVPYIPTLTVLNAPNPEP